MDHWDALFIVSGVSCLAFILWLFWPVEGDE